MAYFPLQLNDERMRHLYSSFIVQAKHFTIEKLVISQNVNADTVCRLHTESGKFNTF